MTEHLPDGETRNLRILAERIRSRRTTNMFLKQEVSRELMLEAIELARWAPNHHLTEPWHFYLLGDEKKAASAELIRTIVTENKISAEQGIIITGVFAVLYTVLIAATEYGGEMKDLFPVLDTILRHAPSPRVGCAAACQLLTFL